LEATPFIRDIALSWWARFTTIEQAIELLSSASEGDLQQLMFLVTGKGSIAFIHNMSTLRNIIEQD
jgi:hypothetical protein